MSGEKSAGRFGMTMMFAAIVFSAIVISAFATAGAVYIMVRTGFISFSNDSSANGRRLILAVASISIPVGLCLALIFSKVPLRPIRELVAKMNQLASGDFQTRVQPGSIMSRSAAFSEVADSFNKMAEELQRTEMLRADFINNFSHEFKTPIVSIAGFAKLLNRGNLTREQQAEYLRVIETEALRLSNMATNVLNLTKVENQTILTDVSEFNLSEQIRSCILLLENKWACKDLDFRLNFGEHWIHANEEQLKQVWINLLDNAVKFTPDCQLIEVQIQEDREGFTVTVMNTGSEIPPEKQKKIFNKFYQADESHATQGNGVGLAIVKRITELHGGTVSVTSRDMVTVFTVWLPRLEVPGNS